MMRRYPLIIEDLKKTDIGRWVEYNNGFGEEKGRIKSWNEEYVFVVYNCEGDGFEKFTGVPTRPQNLEFVDGKDLV